MKAYKESKGRATLIFHLGNRWRWWSAVHPGCFKPRETPNVHYH